MAKLSVGEIKDNNRLDAFLAESGAYSSRSLAAKFCDAEKIKVNGVVANKKLKIAEGDIIEYEPAVEDTELVGEDIDLDIRYEDDEILVISKPAGLVCHPAYGHPNGTLVNALIHHCGKEHLCDIQTDHKRIGIVHRLDADTSGLIICAKTDEAGLALSASLKAHEVARCYKTLVYGNVKQDTGKIDVPLLRTVNKRPKMIASNDPKAKNAITEFKVLERINSDFGEFSLVECNIITGRTHQIRAHMDYIKHSVVGDWLYASSKPKDFDAEKDLGLTRQFLHSWRIGFNHPKTGEHLEFEDDLPKDLKKVIDIIKKSEVITKETKRFAKL